LRQTFITALTLLPPLTSHLRREKYLALFTNTQNMLCCKQQNVTPLTTNGRLNLGSYILTGLWRWFKTATHIATTNTAIFTGVGIL
jgi:hypothetical protein